MIFANTSKVEVSVPPLTEEPTAPPQQIAGAGNNNANSSNNNTLTRGARRTYTMKTKTSILRKSALLGVIAFASLGAACPASNPTCDQGPDRSANADCWFGDCRLEHTNQPYPTLVQRGGTVKLDMSCGVASRNMQFLSTSLHVSVCNLLGQHVTSFTAGPFPPNSNIQQVPIWSNINVAAGQYLVTVVADLGPCGTKTLISNFQITVV